LRRDNALKRFEVVTCVDVPVLCYRLRSFPTVIEVFRIEIFRSCYPVISNSFSRPVPVPKKIGAGTVGSRSRSKKMEQERLRCFRPFTSLGRGAHLSPRAPQPRRHNSVLRQPWNPRKQPQRIRVGRRLFLLTSVTGLSHLGCGRRWWCSTKCTTASDTTRHSSGRGRTSRPHRQTHGPASLGRCLGSSSMGP
jgi:hypothetical protein